MKQVPSRSVVGVEVRRCMKHSPVRYQHVCHNPIYPCGHNYVCAVMHGQQTIIIQSIVSVTTTLIVVFMYCAQVFGLNNLLHQSGIDLSMCVVGLVLYGLVVRLGL